MGKRCSVKGCISEPPKLFFTVPTSEDKRKVWLSLLYKEFSLKKYSICALHFSQNQFDNYGKLKSDAVPDLIDNCEHESDSNLCTDSDESSHSQEVINELSPPSVEVVLIKSEPISTSPCNSPSTSTENSHTPQIHVKIPRKDLSLLEKIIILDRIKNHPNTTHRKLAEITNVPKSTISRLLQQEQQLRNEWTRGSQRGNKKRKREGKAPEVEDALNQWFSIVTEKGITINSALLKSKSKELAKNLGYKNFKATDGWLSRWKSRYNINRKKCKDSINGTSGGEDIPEVTNENARKFIVGLRKYFMQDGNEDSPISALDICADFVQLQSIKSTLDKFQTAYIRLPDEKCHQNPVIPSFIEDQHRSE